MLFDMALEGDVGLGDRRVKPKVWEVYERKNRRQKRSDEVVEREKEN